jgi:hypothetical protein
MDRTSLPRPLVTWRGGGGLLAAALLTCARAYAATPVHDAEHGFSLTVPDGFVAQPAGAGAGPRMLHAFMRGTPDDASFAALQIDNVGGTIGREPLDRAIVEKAARDSARQWGMEATGFAYRPTKWKGFELEIIIERLAGNDKKLVSVSVPVPLARQAIEVTLLGDAAHEEALVGELQTILASLDGRSSWLSDEQRSQKLGRLVGALIGVPIGIAIVLWVRRRRQRAQA